MKIPGSTGIFGKLLLGSFIGVAMKMLIVRGKEHNKTRKKIFLKGDKLSMILRSRFNAFIEAGEKSEYNTKTKQSNYTGTTSSSNLKAVRQTAK